MAKVMRDNKFYNLIYDFNLYKISRSNLTFVFSLFCFSFLIISPLNAKNNIEKQIKTGLKSCYNFEWNKAENVFHNIINKYPDDPRGYHYEASIYLWYYLSNKDEKDLNTFEAYSDTALDKASKILGKNSDDIDVLYLIGADYCYRAIAFGKAEKFLDAAWASKKSESYLSETLEKDSTMYDAYLGLGLYNFAIGQISSAYRWALNLAGIHGDKATGLKYIKIAAKKGRLSKVEAQYYLSQILTNFLHDFPSASYYLSALIKKYPKNLLFDYSYSVLKIKSRQLNKAEKILKEILSKDNQKFRQLISYSNFLMGDVFYRRNHFDSAKVYYTDFLNTTLDNDYTGIAYYRMAVSYEITGNRNEAVNYFKLTGKGNMDLDDDIYAERKGKYYAEHPLKPVEISLIEDNNLIESRKYQAAYDSLNTLLAKTKSDNFKSQIYLYLSKASYWLGKYDKSVNFALSAEGIKNNDETWIKPFAYYYAARAQYKVGKDSSASDYIEKAENYSNYDYQNKLKNLIFALNVKV